MIVKILLDTQLNNSPRLDRFPPRCPIIDLAPDSYSLRVSCLVTSNKVVNRRINVFKLQHAAKGKENLLEEDGSGIMFDSVAGWRVILKRWAQTEGVAISTQFRGWGGRIMFQHPIRLVPVITPNRELFIKWLDEGSCSHFLGMCLRTMGISHCLLLNPEISHFLQTRVLPFQCHDPIS